MKRTFLAVAWMPMSLAACGAGNNAMLQTLGDHTPAIVGQSTLTGAVNPEQQLDLRIALPLRDENSLDAFIGELYDPQSASYGQYLTPDEFAARFAPDANAVSQVRTSLLANGFDVDDDAHGTLLNARVSVADAETFFHTQLSTYQDANGNAFYAPSAAVAVDRGLPIAAIYGLHTAFAYTSSFTLNTGAQSKVAANALNAAAIRQAYNVPGNASGAGQVVGIYELDGYAASDIAAYATNNSISGPPLTNVLVDGISGAVQTTGGQGEVTLDIELVIAMTPGAKQVRIYEAANSGNGAIDEWNELANPSLGDKMLVPLISSSWGLAETQESSGELNQEAAIFKQMAAQGQTVLVASGDQGAKTDGKTLSVSDPASQPYVIGVGGTTLSTSGGGYGSESAWASGGGGISSTFAIPAWQKALLGNDAQASTTMRNVPDVSLDADPASGYAIYLQGKTQNGFGGTSCAAPLWAAFFAQVNQARATNGLAPMGFAAPALYLVAQNAAQYAADFHDVKSGNNGTYNAGTGYDNATGLGSFNAATLMQTLTTGYGRSIFSAPPGFTPSGQ